MYIREAHPSDGWQMPANEQQGIVVKQPTTTEERVEVAEKCKLGLEISIPMLVDGMDNAAGLEYGAWPDRLYVIDKDGNIFYKGGMGPKGFNPHEMEQALKKLFAK